MKYKKSPTNAAGLKDVHKASKLPFTASPHYKFVVPQHR